MKIRTSFVSNSSSASFVLVGFELNEKFDMAIFLENHFGVSKEEIDREMEKYGYVDDLFWSKLHDSDIMVMLNREMGSPRNNSTIIGKQLAVNIEDKIGTTLEINYEEIKEEVDDLRDRMEQDGPIRIYIGNKMA